MKVAFVVIGGVGYGYGHFKRVEAILPILPNHIKVCIFSNIRFLKKNYSSVISLKLFKLNNFPKLKKLIQDKGYDTIWFDLPDIFYKKIKIFHGLGSKLVSYNMFEKKTENLLEDIAIYPRFSETTYNETKGKIKKFQLSGRDYIVVDPKFFYLKELKENKVVITMGGSDPKSFTELVVDSLLSLDLNLFKFKVILPKNKKKSDFNLKGLNKNSITFDNFENLDFAHELKTSKLAIINGGNTRYECVASRTYFLALSIHKKQYDITGLTTKFGFGKNIGVFSKNKVKKLTENIEKFVKLKKKNSKTIKSKILSRKNSEIAVRKIFSVIDNNKF